MAFLRMLARGGGIAPENKDFADRAASRLAANLPRLDKQNVTTYPEPGGLRNVLLKEDDRATVDLSSPVQGAKIYFTIDGTPTRPEQSRDFRKPADLAVNRKTGRVDEDDRRPADRPKLLTVTYLWRDLLPAAQPIAEKRSGLTYGIDSIAWRGKPGRHA